MGGNVSGFGTSRENFSSKISSIRPPSSAACIKRSSPRPLEAAISSP
jgi:hypothetical protein